MTDHEVEYSSTRAKRFIRADFAVPKSSEEFQLAPNLRNFDRLEKGQVIAFEGKKDYQAEAGQCIILPH